jgi:hypothetical protein
MGVVVNDYLLPANPSSIVSEKKLSKALLQVSKILADYSFQQAILKKAKIEQAETCFYDFHNKNDFKLLEKSDVELYEENYQKVIPLNIQKEKIKTSMIDEHTKIYLGTRKPYITYPTLKYIKLSLSIDYFGYETFIGDVQHFFNIDYETNSLNLTEYYGEDLKHLRCKGCDAKLGIEFIEYLKRIISNKRIKRKKFNGNNHVFNCPNCNSVQNVNDLTGFTILGRFRIRLEQGIPDYPSLFELIEKEIDCELVYNQYMYP